MLLDHLRDHDGVITLAQARRAGLSEDAVNRLVRSGRWERCVPGVFLAADHQVTDAARTRIAVWGYGVTAAASGLAAAWWLGLTQYAPDVVEVTIPRESRRVRRDGTRVRRRDLDPVDVTEERGLRTTALNLTVIEAASRRGGGARLLDNALQRRRAELPGLWHAELRNKGRHGAPRARQLLHAVGDGTRSEAERLFARLLRKAGITGWRANRRVVGYECDFVFASAKVVVEVDGYEFHSAPEPFQRDRTKQNALTLAGFTVLRFTWLDLVEYPDRVVADVLRAIRGR